jgi:hypothetical protein
MPELKDATLTFVEYPNERYTRPLESLRTYPFESVRPARKFGVGTDQPNLHVLACSSKTDSLIPCESLIEADAVELFDRDAAVVGIAAQPFLLQAKLGRDRKKHWPDFFLRLRSGGARVVDVCMAKSMSDRGRVEKFELMQLACEQLGWEYQIQHELPPAYRANLHALAAFKRKPARLDELAPLVLEAAARPATIGALDALDHPASVRPVVFHLIYHGELAANLFPPLRQTTNLAARTGREEGADL